MSQKFVEHVYSTFLPVIRQERQGFNTIWKTIKRKKNKLRHFTMTWADKVISGHIMRQDAWFYFQKILESPIIATSMSSKKCHFTESPALCMDLHDSGLPYNIQRDIVSGPHSFLDLNNNGSIYVTQGRHHITALMKFEKSECITVKQLISSIESTNLEIRCRGPLFANKYPHIKKIVLKHG